MIISSQRYLDDETVGAKQDAYDYTVYTFSVGIIDGINCVVVIDGHHSLEAARRDGVTPNYTPVSGDIEREYLAELDSVGAQAWLENHYHDSDYYNVETGINVW